MAEEDENLRSVKAQRDAAQAAQDLKRANADMAESFRISADVSRQLNKNLTEASSIIDILGKTFLSQRLCGGVPTFVFKSI